jgi:predicted PurR-regulated permease PerM
VSPSALSTRAIVRIVLTVCATVGLLYVLYLVRSVVLLLFISVFLAVALGPAVDFFQRGPVPRGAAILVVYVLMMGSVVGVGLLVVPPIVDQVQQLSDDIPGYLDDLRRNDTFRQYDDKYDITQKLNEQAALLPSKLGDAAGALRSITVGVFSTILQLVTVLTMTFFLLLEGKGLASFLMRLRGPEKEGKYRAIAGDIYRSTAGYVAGNLIISVCAGLSAYVVMSILGVPFAVPLAVLMAFLDLIPLVGATIGGVVIGIVTAFHDFPSDTIVWLLFFIIYQQVENNVLQPLVYKRTVNVSPLLVIVAILIGSSLLGVLGALVAIPVAAAIQIVVKDVWRAERHDVAPLVAGSPLDVGPPPPAV